MTRPVSTPYSPPLNVLPTATTLLPSPFIYGLFLKGYLSLARAALEGLSEEEELDLCTIVSGFRTVYRGILKYTYGRRLRAHRHLRHHGGCWHLHP